MLSRVSPPIHNSCWFLFILEFYHPEQGKPPLSPSLSSSLLPSLLSFLLLPSLFLAPSLPLLTFREFSENGYCSVKHLCSWQRVLCLSKSTCPRSFPLSMDLGHSEKPFSPFSNCPLFKVVVHSLGGLQILLLHSNESKEALKEILQDSGMSVKLF